VVLALTTGDVFLILVIAAVPFALLSFLGARRALGQIGKGQFAIEQDLPQKQGGGGQEQRRRGQRATALG
jgi:hypothetical protein